MSDPITNEAGDVALKYRQPAQVLAPNTPSGNDYVFVVRADISMAWVDPQDVDNLINRIKTCCGGTRKKQFHYANESDVRRWTNGGGR